MCLCVYVYNALCMCERECVRESGSLCVCARASMRASMHVYLCMKRDLKKRGGVQQVRVLQVEPGDRVAVVVDILA
jgi:orotate phosphoribosyltransferase